VILVVVAYCLLFVVVAYCLLFVVIVVIAVVVYLDENTDPRTSGEDLVRRG